MFGARTPTFRAFAVTVVPGMAALDAAGWSDVDATLKRALANRPPRMVRQLRIFLQLLERLPVLRYGRGFSALDGARRTAFLHRLERSRLTLVRRGVWGLRTLVYMSWYTRPQTMEVVGYRAHVRGWSARLP